MHKQVIPPEGTNILKHWVSNTFSLIKPFVTANSISIRKKVPASLSNWTYDKAEPGTSHSLSVNETGN